MPTVDVPIPIGRVLGARGARLAGGAVIACLLLWLGGYAAGLWPWLGYASQSTRTLGVGGLPVGRIGDGQTRLGFATFYYFAGQTIVVDYDATIGSGCLSLHVWRIGGEDDNRCVETSGKGEWTAPVTQSGLYHVFATPRTEGGGSAMSYSLWWGARR